MKKGKMKMRWDARGFGLERGGLRETKEERNSLPSVSDHAVSLPSV